MLIIAKLFMSDEIETFAKCLFIAVVSHTDGKLDLEILAYSYRKLSLYNITGHSFNDNRVSII